MTIDDLRTAAPAAFALEPAPDVSNRYVYIPTMPIVERLLDNGWHIKHAHQRENDPFASHRIDFIVPTDSGLDQRVLGEMTPTASLYNSHNRTRRMSFTIGMHVTICANQLQAALSQHSCERIHLENGPDVEALIDSVFSHHSDYALTIKQMKDLPLYEREQVDFAVRAEMIGGNHASPLFVDRSRARQLLVDRHAHQREPSDSLWRTYNVVQENLIEGGRSGRRGVHEIIRNFRLNNELWSVAKAFLN